MRCCLFFILLFINNWAIGQSNYTDYQMYKSLSFLKDYKIVLLGEPTHGEGNVFEEKTKIIKYLIEECGYSVVAFESGFYDMYFAQELINLNKEVNSSEFISRALFPVWSESKNFQPLLKYIDQNKNTIRIAGFDCQLTGDYSREFLLNSILALLRKHDSIVVTKVNIELIEEAIGAFSEDYTFPEDIVFKDFQSQMRLLLGALEKINKQNTLSLKEHELATVYIQSIRNLWSIGKDYYANKDRVLAKATFKAKDSNHRDSMMAQNLFTLIQQYPNEKIICWGAGTHFMNDPSHLANDELKYYKPMGMYLKQKLGENNVFNLTFISAGGKYGIFSDTSIYVPTVAEGSIEYDLTKTAKDSLLILDKSVYKNKLINSYCLEYTPIKAEWSKLFDAFIYLPYFTPNKLAADTIKNSNYFPPITDANIEIKDSLTTGLLVDKQTEKPIAFATIRFTDNQFTTQTNNKGEFKIPNSKIQGMAVIQALSYHTNNIIIQQGKLNKIFLSPQLNELKGIEIISKKPDVLDIVKNVKLNYTKNYEQRPYSQTIYENRILKNFDTSISEYELLSDNYIHIPFNRVLKQNYLEIKQNKYTKKLVDKIGIIGGSRIGYNGFIENFPLLKGDRYKKYSYKLLSVFEDSLLGLVYKIEFVSKKTLSRYTNDFFTKSYKGILYIRKADFAILKLESQLIRNTAVLQQWTKKNYPKRQEMNSWNVYPETENEQQVLIYSKNEKDSLYYLSYANEQWQVKGYLMENKQKVKLVSDNSYYDVGNIKKIEDLQSIDFSSFKFPSQTTFNAAFWSSFVSPQKNDRIYLSLDEK